MRPVYAETSAVLAWLLAEPTAASVRAVLRSAPLVATAELTLVECDRALHRAVGIGVMTDFERGRRRGVLLRAARLWRVAPLSPGVISRSRERFPKEPIRTLDALHLAAAEAAVVALGDLALLTLDGRVRDNGELLGFDVLPRGVPAAH